MLNTLCLHVDVWILLFMNLQVYMYHIPYLYKRNRGSTIFIIHEKITLVRISYNRIKYAILVYIYMHRCIIQFYESYTECFTMRSNIVKCDFI